MYFPNPNRTLQKCFKLISWTITTPVPPCTYNVYTQMYIYIYILRHRKPNSHGGGLEYGVCFDEIDSVPRFRRPSFLSSPYLESTPILSDFRDPSTVTFLEWIKFDVTYTQNPIENCSMRRDRGMPSSELYHENFFAEETLWSSHNSRRLENLKEFGDSFAFSKRCGEMVLQINFRFVNPLSYQVLFKLHPLLMSTWFCP